MLSGNERTEELVASGHVECHVAVEPKRLLVAMPLTSQV